MGERRATFYSESSIVGPSNPKRLWERVPFLLLPLVIGLSLMATMFLGVKHLSGSPILSPSQATIHYVASDGVCGSAISCYSDIQDVVEASYSHSKSLRNSIDKNVFLAARNEAAWPMFGHDAQHTGRSIHTGPETPALKWRFEAPIIDNIAPIMYAPIIGPSGTVYIGTNGGSLYALNAIDGSVRWNYQRSGSYINGIALGPNGKVYVGAGSSNVYYNAALDRVDNGSLDWTLPLGGYGAVTVPSYFSDTIYIGYSYYRSIYAVGSDDGAIHWSYRTGDASQQFTPPAVAPNGTLYIGSTDGAVYSLDTDGNLRWRYETGDSIFRWAAPTIGTDGTVYIGSSDHYLYALHHEDGTLKWRTQTGDRVMASPALGEDDTVYVGSEDGYVYALDKDNGTVQWRYETDGTISSSPAIDAEGTLFIGSHGSNSGYLYAIDTDDGTLKWKYPIGFYGGNTAPAIGPDGTVYATGSDDSSYYLYAFVAPPNASFTHSSPDWLGQTTAFTNTTVTSGTTNYEWSFGDGAIATQEHPTHTYPAAGVYTVILTATNAAGSGTATDTVTIYSAPSAGFTTDSPRWLGQTTTFTNSTTTTPAGDPSLTHLWDFGDGASSTATDPAHTYTMPGYHTATLTATNPAGSDVAEEPVTVYSPPTVTLATSSPDWLGDSTILTATANTVPAGDPAITVTWDFGDGTVQEGEPITDHTYNAPGTYTVIVTATNPAGAESTTDTVTIEGPPGAGFTHSSPDWLGQVTTFTNTTTGAEPISYAWRFGDGTSGTAASPTHTFTSAGAYTVIMTATNPAGADTVSDTIIVYSPPMAVFDAAPTTGIRPLTVTFTDTSTTIPPGDPTLTYQWDFGDGATSDEQHPMHTYTGAGTYTVVLTVSNDAGSNNVTHSELITVEPVPVEAGFTASPTSGIAPLIVTFTNTTTGDYQTSLWDFGDGMTDTVEHPSHTYEDPGTYTVTLTAEGLGGSDTITKTNLLTVYSPVEAGFVAHPVSGVAPLTVTFTNTTSGDYETSLWDFGDGTTSTVTHPIHTYTTGGAFTVTLTVAGPGGTDTTIEQTLIWVDEAHDIYLPIITR